MHVVDVIGVCVVVFALILCATVLARQRFMLRMPGMIPVAMQVPARSSRWLYGMARYAGGELRWYRALGLGSRATRVWRRSEIEVVQRRSPVAAELPALPVDAVVLECRAGEAEYLLALTDSAYTGLVSWLESAIH